MRNTLAGMGVSVNATWESLSEDARRVLTVLAGHPSIPEEDLADAAGVLNTSPSLAELVRVGFLRRSPRGRLVVKMGARDVVAQAFGKSSISHSWNQVFYFSAVHKQATRHWRASILKSVDWALDIGMSPLDRDALLARTGGALLMAWACKATEDAYWSQMEIGDLCVACTPGVTDAFTIAGRTDSCSFGKAVWLDPDYCRVYFLVDRQPVTISREQFLRDCGFAPNYIIQGTRRLTEERIARVESEYGSLERWLTPSGEQA